MIQVDVLKAARAISDPASLLAAFSVPGNFTLSVTSLSINVSNQLMVTASGINVTYDPNYDPSTHGERPDARDGQRRARSLCRLRRQRQPRPADADG